ncbi:MAG: ROK family protein [Chloroflexota bacterium]
MIEYVIGVDIGGTKIAAHSCDSTFKTLHEISLPCPATEGGDAIMNVVIECCRQLQEKTDGELKAIGIGAAGQVNKNTGTVIDANENITDWIGTPIAHILGDAFAVPVVVENDVRAMALAEATIGAGKAYQHLLCITAGTGVGGAIVLNGRLWHGTHFSAGEIGYLYAGENLTLEDLASGIALQEDYDFHLNYTLQEIAKRANEGERKARQILRDGSTILAEVLAPILAFLDPQALIVGGGVPQAGHWWWKYFLKTLEEYPLKSVQQIDILPAKLGNRAGMVGASILAWKGIGES